MSFLKKYAFAIVLLDVLWALLLATFGKSLLGTYLGVDGLTGVSGWLLIFVVALFQGAIFAVVGSIFATLALVAFAKAPPAIRWLMVAALVADIAWGVLVATFGAGLLEHGSTQIGVDGTFSAVLFWFIAFVAGCWQGAVFILCGTFVLGVIAFIAAIVFGGKKNGDGSRPNFKDRNPGEPPHR